MRNTQHVKTETRIKDNANSVLLVFILHMTPIPEVVRYQNYPMTKQTKRLQLPNAKSYPMPKTISCQKSTNAKGYQSQKLANAKRNLIPSSNSGTTQSAAQEKEVCAEKTVRLRANNVPPAFVCRVELDSAEEDPTDMTGNW